MNQPFQPGALPLEFLIAAPLEALVKAQALSARTTAEFVSEVGFETDEKGVSRARMVDFEYVTPRTDPDNPSEVIDTTVRVSLPVLTLMQIPNVVVDEATVELNLRVATAPNEIKPASLEAGTAAITTSKSKKEDLARAADLGRISALPIRMPISPVRMVGAVAAPKYADQAALVKVSIKLKQAPTPEGLAQIMSLLGDATTARPTGGK